jgi:hypothetical protein
MGRGQRPIGSLRQWPLAGLAELLPLAIHFTTAALRPSTEVAMPHAHAAAVVDRLLRRLGSAACRLEVPPNIDGDLAHVWRTLVRLQDVLVSLEIRPEVQEWMGDIKQVAYDVEDLVDELEDHNSMESQMSGCIAVGEVWFDRSLKLLPMQVLFPFRNASP